MEVDNFIPKILASGYVDTILPRNEAISCLSALKDFPYTLSNLTFDLLRSLDLRQ